MDLARPLREAGIPVCIGGFHAAGSLAMLPEPPPELREAWRLGISIFAGEAEGRLDEVLRDAYQGTLKPLYDYTSDLPGIEGVPVPFLARDKITRNMSNYTSFDAGRGCPFQCSFCTIINVQGRKSRYRTADDVEKIVRENYAQGIKNFFITDDNFARNRNWEQIFDRLIELREGEGIPIKLIIQVDTLCHRIPNFIEKAGRAGAKRVFIGLENISPDNLIGGQEEAESDHRVPHHAAGMEGGPCDHLLRLHHRFPERYARTRDPGHRDHQARAAGRLSRVLLPDTVARVGGPSDAAPERRVDGPGSEQVRRRARHHRPPVDVGRGVARHLPRRPGRPSTIPITSRR